MKYVKFGRTDMEVSTMCVGTMTWGSMNTEDQAHEQLDTAFAKGCNFIDVAEMYPVPTMEKWCTSTECIVGNWLEKRLAGGGLAREKVYIATKISGSVKTMFGPDLDRVAADRLDVFKSVKARRCNPLKAKEEMVLPQLDAANMMEACQASIRRLKCGYIDLYQLHWPQRYVPCFGKHEYLVEKEEARSEESPADPAHFDAQVLGIKALLDLGLIKNWGLSNETPFGVMMFCMAADRLGVPRPASVQNDFSFVARSYESSLAETCKHFGVVGLPYGALCGGTLSGKYNEGGDKYKESSPTEPRHVQYPAFQARYHKDAVKAAANKYKLLAEQHDLKPASMAYAWALSRTYNASIITGTTSVAQVEEACDALGRLELSAEVLKGIDAIHAEDRNPSSADFEAKYP